MTNPDRTVILDLSAVEAARGPQPNDYFICLTRHEGAICALAVAESLNTNHCNDEDCADCNQARRLFWDIVNDLGPRLQAALFSSMAYANIEVPDGPWEEARG